MIELGGNIKLTGFSDVDSGSMVILKKIIGNYARKFSDKCKNFESLEMYLKLIGQKTGKNQMYEIHSKVFNDGKNNFAEVTERNLFFGIDLCLKKLMNSLKD